MNCKNNVYYIIKTKYPDKEKELADDFKKWIKGEYPIPRTEEVKEILRNAENNT